MYKQGAKASEIILEGFADKLADIIIKGEASIGDWNSERGAKINVNTICSCHSAIVLNSIRLCAADAWLDRQDTSAYSANSTCARGSRVSCHEDVLGCKGGVSLV